MKLREKKPNPASGDVLHVTDCLNAGVGELIQQLCENYNPQQISILWDSHSDSPTSNISMNRFNSNHHWNRGFLKRIFHLRRIVREIQPDIIHAHSSMAGFYVRLFTFRRVKTYSPHCFSFDRLDISPARRLFYLFIEVILHQFTSYYVVNWPVEALEVSKFKPKKQIYFVRPEVTQFKDMGQYKNSIGEQDPIFISVGRLRPQKDPAFFASVAREFNKLSSARFIWIGTGDENIKLQLIEAGVIVIPWMNSSELANYYQNATATLITSKWESGPLTLFESINCSTPVVLRASKSSIMYGIPVFKSPSEVVEECIRIANMKSTIELVREQREKSASSIELIMSKPGITPLRFK